MLQRDGLLAAQTTLLLIGKANMDYLDLYTVTDAAKSKDFFASTKDGKVTLKRNHNYFFQIQGQMAICKRNWCDFVIMKTKEMIIERIIFDPKLWQETLPKLESFYDKAILPELACPRVPQNQPIRELLQEP